MRKSRYIKPLVKAKELSTERVCIDIVSTTYDGGGLSRDNDFEEEEEVETTSPWEE